MSTPRIPRSAAKGQRGVILLFSLIALVIMLIAAVAMVRSFNSSLFTAGNIGFKRDMQNQSERAVAKALTAFKTGSLNTPGNRSDTSTANNYSASILAVNDHGIPMALQDDSAFALVGVATNDITDANEPSLAGQNVKIRYVVDRMCSTAGLESSIGSNSCMLADNPTPAGTSSSNQFGPDRAPLCSTCASAAPQGVVYRLSVRVIGPRNTRSFFQSTFTVPS